MKKLIIFANIAIFIVLIASCAPRYNTVDSVNNRKSLRKEQIARMKNAEYWEKEEARKNARKIEADKKDKKMYKLAVKKGRKRHLKWQDDEVKKRIKKNKKQSEKNFKY